MSDAKSDARHRELVAEAFLLIGKAQQAGDDGRTMLDEWQARSPEHVAALATAEAEWALYANLDDLPLSRREHLKLIYQGQIARVAEHPHHLVTAGVICLCAVLGLTVATGLLPYGTDSSLNKPTETPLTGKTLSSDSAERFTTLHGEQRELYLEDGSRVWLSWDTEVRVHFDSNERHVDLQRGTAIFKVATDTDRPFTVRAGGAQAQVLGTEFSVHRHNGQRVFIEVMEGRVRVNATIADNPVELAQAQAIAFNGVSLSEVRQANIASIGAWREGLLVFENRPLKEVFDELGHYTQRHLHVDTLPAPSTPINATFFIEHADEAVESLASLFDLTLTTRRDGSVFVHATPR